MLACGSAFFLIDYSERWTDDAVAAAEEEVGADGCCFKAALSAALRGSR